MVNEITAGILKDILKDIGESKSKYQEVQNKEWKLLKNEKDSLMKRLREKWIDTMRIRIEELEGVEQLIKENYIESYHLEE